MPARAGLKGLLFVALFVSACAGGGTEPMPCSPGETTSCTCSNGDPGTRTCEGGMFGVCSCTPVDEDCSFSNPSGVCPSGSSCIDGACCTLELACGSRCCRAGQQCMGGFCATPCGPADPGGFCDPGLTCVLGSCCPSARACNTSCCPEGQTCNDGTCSAPVCSTANPTGTCPDGGTCLDGECCPAGKACAGACCGASQTCSNNQCTGACVPSCGPAECGSDGCGGFCGPMNGDCLDGFACTTGTCILDPARSWQVRVTTGGVATTNRGSDWDFGGGAPDPLVCATANTAERCSPAKDNTFTPDWRVMGVGPIVAETTAARLQAGIKIIYLDEDIAADDIICEIPTITFPAARFKERTGRISCPGVAASYFEFTLTPRPR
jgi:hypothetical protein